MAVELPGAFSMAPAHPNPFTLGTRFRLVVAVPQHVQVHAYNLLGQRVATLYEAPMQADRPVTLRLDGRGLPSGVYVIRAEGEHLFDVQQVMLVR